jgi:hypothetical protein
LLRPRRASSRGSYSAPAPDLPDRATGAYDRPASGLASAIVNPECDSQEALSQLIDRCAALLSAVDDMLGNWKPGEGLPMRTAADMLLQTVLARSTRTYRAAMLLATEGMGEQTRMLGRSLFEDMVDAHWITGLLSTPTSPSNAQPSTGGTASGHTFRRSACSPRSSNYRRGNVSIARWSSRGSRSRGRAVRRKRSQPRGGQDPRSAQAAPPNGSPESAG